MATINLLEIKHVVWVAEALHFPVIHFPTAVLFMLPSFTETASAKIYTSVDASC